MLRSAVEDQCQQAGPGTDAGPAKHGIVAPSVRSGGDESLQDGGAPGKGRLHTDASASARAASSISAAVIVAKSVAVRCSIASTREACASLVRSHKFRTARPLPKVSP